MSMKKIIFVMIMLSTAFSGAKAQKVGVALSGGAALGYAHLGVLQAMEEAGIRPECVSGTSMGAVMGMMYAAGYKPQEIKEIIKKEHFDHLWGLFGPSLPRRGGVIPMERIRKVLLKYVPHDCFDSLPIRFYTCSYDITNLHPLYCGSGDSLVAHVLASAAIPGVFVPQRIDSSWHVDGGVCDNLPVTPLLAEGCDLRIGSHLLLVGPSGLLSPESVLMRSVSYMTLATATSRLAQLTDVIAVDPGQYRMTDFNKVDELYQIGYEAGKRYFAQDENARMEERAIRELCFYMVRNYPMATLQDIYKTCYQDFFGAEHLMNDTAAARRYLEQELEECKGLKDFGMPEQEPTGFRHRYTRVSIECVLNGDMTLEQLLEKFIAAASQPEKPSGSWEQEWSRIERIALQTNPEWHDQELQAGLQQAAKLSRAVRHSDTFRSAYHPHYRIVRAE